MVISFIFIMEIQRYVSGDCYYQLCWFSCGSRIDVFIEYIIIITIFERRGKPKIQELIPVVGQTIYPRSVSKHSLFLNFIRESFPYSKTLLERTLLLCVVSLESS